MSFKYINQAMTEWQLRNLRNLSKRMEIPVAQIIRTAVTQYLENTVGIKREYSNKGIPHEKKPVE